MIVPSPPPLPTADAVPTVSGVEAIALTLDTVQVDVTVSDDGGQPVLEYTVSQTGGNGWVAYVTGECHNGYILFWCHRSQSMEPE